VVSALLSLTLAGGWAVGKGSPPVDTEERLGFEATPHGGVHFSGRLDRGSVLEHGDGLVGMELVLSADEQLGAHRTAVPTDLVVVLDNSGSMAGKPLADALGSIRELIARLGDDDRFALVLYSSRAQLWIPMQDATARNRAHWLTTVDRIGPAGGTNMASGIDLANDTIAKLRRSGRLPRVILLSDGQANEGDHSLEGLRARAARAAAGEYVLSTVGVGEGFDEAVMTALADAGTGNFYYVPDGSDLGDVFADEFASARDTIASALSVEIDLAPGIELVEAAGYPIERSGRTVRFRPGTLFSGQERRIWLNLRVPTDRVAEFALGEFRLSYREPQTPLDSPLVVIRFDDIPEMACVRDEAQYVASLDESLVVRSIAEDKFSALKQSVAAAVRSGDLEEAEKKIEAFKRDNAAPLRALGYAPEDTDTYQEADVLALEVKDAFNASRPAAARNKLSKGLAASAQDVRRQGAKRK
jgi:Ca-activated chloride channel family protein